MAKLDYKSQNRQQQYRKLSVARTISDCYPEIDHVNIEVTLHFHTWVGSTKPVEYKSVMTPDSKIHLYYECPNRDCTGSGFALTDELERCLRNKQKVSGTMDCNGKEDSKYIHASGCSCMTSCEYKITPVLK